MTDQIENVEASTEATTPESTQEITQQEAGNDQESTETSFIDLITDEELKSSKSLSNFKDINGLAKSYINLEKKLGAPKEPETYTEDQYNFEAPENYTINEEVFNPLKAKALELGMKPEGFNELAKTFIESEMKQSAANAKALEEMESTLKSEWGNAYDEKLKASFNTWKTFAGEENAGIIEDLDPKAQLAIAKIMDKVSSSISESSVGKIPVTQNVTTKEAALEKIAEIRADKTINEGERRYRLSKYYDIAYAGEDAKSLGIGLGVSNGTMVV